MNIRVDYQNEIVYSDLHNGTLFVHDGDLCFKMRGNQSVNLTKFLSPLHVSDLTVVRRAGVTKYSKRWALCRFSLTGSTQTETNSRLRMLAFKLQGKFLTAETRIIDNKTGEHDVV